ncbi:MAG: type II toxin-antitoxin system HicB family antitoxin [Youngiibacter sp.]|nr:type II toxin-antitoxin system HicB family antitoxin [Youngiibacter sp.]
MKDRYVYPAVFEYDGDDINVSFPDLPGCLTFGNNEAEAMFNAKEALEGHLFVMEELGRDIPDSTSIYNISRRENGAIVLVDAWMPLIRDQEYNKAVKKTLTIPKWLNDIAEENKVNFSHLLHAALKKHLGINR